MDLFGFTKDEMKNFSARDFIPESDLEDSESKLTELLSGENLPIYERIFQKKSGELFHAEINLSLIEDHVTNRKFFQSIMRDITKRKITEVAKERERRVFQKIANAAIQTTDIHEFCNRALADLLEELDFNFGTLRILDKDLDALVPIAVNGIPDHLTRELNPIIVSDDKYIVSYVIRNKKPIFTGDARNESFLKKYQSRLELFNVIALLS
ncbi:MAG: PAS domain S-box protein [Candidatus Heimdallarchaeota archaeon]